MSLLSLCIGKPGFHMGLSVSLAAPRNNVSASVHSGGKAYIHSQPHSCASRRPLLVLTVDRGDPGWPLHSAHTQCLSWLGNGTDFYRALCLSEPSAALLTPPHFSNSSPFVLCWCLCRSFDLLLLDLPYSTCQADHPLKWGSHPTL